MTRRASLAICQNPWFYTSVNHGCIQRKIDYQLRSTDILNPFGHKYSVISEKESSQVEKCPEYQLMGTGRIASQSNSEQASYQE